MILLVKPAKAFLGVTCVSKINPGSNFNEDNDVVIATPGMFEVNIPEPKMLEKGEFQCPGCGKTFNSKEDYISHALVNHQMAPSKIKRPMQLSSVPFEKGFHFYIELGKYTGITAISLDEFAAKLGIVSVESVTFHFQRRDYQRWLIDVIRNNELAKKIDEIKVTDASGENLRKVLLQTVQENIAGLKGNSAESS
jgi:hypothetical protein